MANLGRDDLPKLRNLVATFAFNYNLKKALDKYLILIDWIRYSKMHLSPTHHPSELKYCMPIDHSVEIENGSADGLLCKDALLTVIDLGKYVWNKLAKATKTNSPLLQHGRIGKANNGFKDGSLEKRL